MGIGDKLFGENKIRSNAESRPPSSAGDGFQARGVRPILNPLNALAPSDAAQPPSALSSPISRGRKESDPFAMRVKKLDAAIGRLIATGANRTLLMNDAETREAALGAWEASKDPDGGGYVPREIDRSSAGKPVVIQPNESKNLDVGAETLGFENFLELVEFADALRFKPTGLQQAFDIRVRRAIEGKP